MDSRKHVLMYVTRVTGYVLAEVKALAKIAKVSVLNCPSDISEKMHAAAPEINWIDASSNDSVEKIVAELHGDIPDVYLCAGWACPLPNRLAKYLRGKGCKTIVGVDTPWRGDLRQVVHKLLSRFTLRRMYDYGWAAGLSQRRHLRELGFEEHEIMDGFYAADVDRFSKIANLESNVTRHVFLYVGRYAPVKNMRRMESAFIKASNRIDNCDWKLVCIGNGELWNDRTIHPRIQHLGYKTPLELQDFIRGCGCAVVPSIYEPWGVVTHEFAAAALPILCSREVQSGSAYVKDGVNGFLFNPFSEDDIAQKFYQIMNLDQESLFKMRCESMKLGMSYTPEMWARRLIAVC